MVCQLLIFIFGTFSLFFQLISVFIQFILVFNFSHFLAISHSLFGTDGSDFLLDFKQFSHHFQAFFCFKNVFKIGFQIAFKITFQIAFQITFFAQRASWLALALNELSVERVLAFLSKVRRFAVRIINFFSDDVARKRQKLIFFCPKLLQIG